MKAVISKGPEFDDWTRDVAKIAGIEVMAGKENRKKTIRHFLKGEFLILSLLVSLTLAGSATYLLASAENASLFSSPTTTTSTSSPITSSSTTTSSTSTTSTTSTTTSTSSTTSTTSTTTSTSTTTIPCGGNMQPACKKNVEINGCDKGNILGHDKLCHIPCVKSVPSGTDKPCGGFALSFCDSGLGYAL